MAIPIKLKLLTEEERGVLVESIPLLRIQDKYYWDDPEFKRLYQKWLTTTNSAYHKDGGFEQFRLSIALMRKTMPNTYKIAKDSYSEDGDIIIKNGETNDTK